MAGLELISDQGLRNDGRRADELRGINCRLGVLKQADGSAYLEQGQTCVLAAVYGPHEVNRTRSIEDRAVINCQYTTAAFSQTERRATDSRSQQLSLQLQRTLEACVLTGLYPRSQIDVFVQTLQSDGATYAASVNAAALALVDAAVPLRDSVAACSVTYADGEPLLDSSYLEESGRAPSLTVAILPCTERVVLVDSGSRFHMDHLDGLVDSAVRGCRAVHQVLDTKVRQHVAATSQLINRW